MTKYLHLAVMLLLLPVTAHPSSLTFSFTGNLVVTDPYGSVVLNEVDGVMQSYTPISATLTYDTTSGIGSSDLQIVMPDFFGYPATFHDMTLTDLGGNLIEGNVLLDWAPPPGPGGNDMDLHILWDATGFFTAIDFGLEVGDILSGSKLYRDGIAFGGNGDGHGDPEEELIDPNTSSFVDLMSATPYSDSFPDNTLDEGPAPLAAIFGTNGVSGSGTSADGFKGYFNIGSGMSMQYLGSEASVVPVPATVWLFGSGLLGLIGMSKRKKAA